ncbi:hypothetical protein I2483_02810 [Sporosarcina sp. E16_3]|uniref:hypothetical protein n=1 Tax=Sporosarcina sp. E16_3 TaxID=2789293 RepID=UPI001A934029|nr:hypothetical protein [Sporosarcina sp. E16_3]MBO0600583.1 hypothetical protein [Sporosarcina sp. E16_3]
MLENAEMPTESLNVVEIMWNSIFIAIENAVTSVLLCTMSGYAFSKLKFRKKSYSDSKQANLTVLFEKTVDELYTNNVYPQENVNRTDNHWPSFVNRYGLGLMAAGAGSTFNFEGS